MENKVKKLIKKERQEKPSVYNLHEIDITIMVMRISNNSFMLKGKIKQSSICRPYNCNLIQLQTAKEM